MLGITGPRRRCDPDVPSADHRPAGTHRLPRGVHRLRPGARRSRGSPPPGRSRSTSREGDRDGRGPRARGAHRGAPRVRRRRRRAVRRRRRGRSDRGAAAGGAPGLARASRSRCDVSDEADVDAAVARGHGASRRPRAAREQRRDRRAVDARSATPTLEEFRRVIDVNLDRLVPHGPGVRPGDGRSGTGGAIVNLGSIFGQQGVANGAAYCASKGGVALLTHSLALELAPARHPGQHDRARATCSPRCTSTTCASRRRARGVRSTRVERVRATIPLGRHGDRRGRRRRGRLARIPRRLLRDRADDRRQRRGAADVTRDGHDRFDGRRALVTGRRLGHRPGVGGAARRARRRGRHPRPRRRRRRARQRPRSAPCRASRPTSATRRR